MGNTESIASWDSDRHIRTDNIEKTEPVKMFDVLKGKSDCKTKQNPKNSIFNDSDIFYSVTHVEDLSSSIELVMQSSDNETRHHEEECDCGVCLYGYGAVDKYQNIYGQLMSQAGGGNKRSKKPSGKKQPSAKQQKKGQPKKKAEKINDELDDIHNIVEDNSPNFARVRAYTESSIHTSEIERLQEKIFGGHEFKSDTPDKSSESIFDQDDLYETTQIEAAMDAAKANASRNNRTQKRVSGKQQTAKETKKHSPDDLYFSSEDAEILDMQYNKNKINSKYSS